MRVHIEFKIKREEKALKKKMLRCEMWNVRGRKVVTFSAPKLYQHLPNYS
jgi:hypothetical protein